MSQEITSSQQALLAGMTAGSGDQDDLLIPDLPIHELTLWSQGVIIGRMFGHGRGLFVEVLEGGLKNHDDNPQSSN